jgi:hypothetical protein
VAAWDTGSKMKRVILFGAGSRRQADVRLALNQIHDLPLRLYVRLNVALGGAQSRMSRQHLHVSQRAAYG